MTDRIDEVRAAADADSIFKALIAAADHAGIGVCVTRFTEGDPQRMELVFANDALLGLLALDRATLHANDVWSSFPMEEAERVIANHARRLRGEPADDVFESVVLRTDGLRIPVELSTSRVALRGTQVNVTFMFDLRHRKAADQALMRSEARFRSLIERAPDGIVIMRWPTVVYANVKAARMLGFTSVEQALGVDITSRLQPAEAAAANERQKQTQQGRDTPPIEYHVTDDQGMERVVEVSSMAIEYDGAPAMLGFARDVTERTLMQRQLMEAAKLAAVGTLAAGVAHEINNPLAYVLLNLEFLERELPKLAADPSRLERASSRLAETRHGAERVKTIVRDLQTFTRKDDGIRGPVDLATVIEASIVVASHELRHRATVVKRFTSVPPVYGNATRFEQLFVNLLLNAAFAFADRDAGDNVVELRLGTDSQGRVVASVRDNGLGMPEEVRRRMFDPFFTTKKAGSGPGLGLPICLAIVQGVGGRIDVQSEVGRGTIVTVELNAHHEQAPNATAGSSGPSSKHERRQRLLIVDDERAVAMSLAEALRDDCDVFTAKSAAEARAAIGAGPSFDLILCDLGMPEESGMQLFADVSKANPELRTRFAFMTGGTLDAETARVLGRLDNPCIDKPFDVEAVRRLLTRTPR